MRFAIYKHKMVTEDNTLIVAPLIVLKEDGLIVKWTDFHKYIRNPRKSIVSVTSSDIERATYIVQLLNYAFFDSYHIRRLIDLDFPIVKSFMQDYAYCELKTDTENTTRSKETVDRCAGYVIDFCEVIKKACPECKINPEEMYTVERVFSKERKKYVNKKVPAFQITYKDSPITPIFRDMPESVFQIIMNDIVENHKNILMLAALGAFAGLRPSEACNVRRADSALGAGIRFETIGNEVTNIYIDLTREQNLRSDLVRVGGIKKERTQKVYPAFITAFYQCYEIYMDYIKGRRYEAAYGPLTCTRDGKAITYATYRNQFQDVVQECIPKMMASEDPKVQIYGQLLLENRINPHIFRHFFSAKLAIYGETPASLKYWRGDKSVESSLVYIQNKSDLEKKFNDVTDKLFDYELWKAGKLNGKPQ